MKRAIHTYAYRILYTFALLVALMSAACTDRLDDTDITGHSDAEPGGIVLSLSGASTRVQAESTETEVEQLDVLMFPTTGENANKCVYHRRFTVSDLRMSDANNYTWNVLLGHKSDFIEDIPYKVYVLANTHADIDNTDGTHEDAGGDSGTAEQYTGASQSAQEYLDATFPHGSSYENPSGTLSDLQIAMQIIQDIHLSGSTQNHPRLFLMDGTAGEKAEEESGSYQGTTYRAPQTYTVTLNDGRLRDALPLYVTLRRAVAKVTVVLTAGGNVRLPLPSWTPNRGNNGQTRYEWRPVNQRTDTYLIDQPEEEEYPLPTSSMLYSPENPLQYNMRIDEKNGTYTVTTYSCSHNWEGTDSQFENRPYLVASVPLFYCAQTLPADITPEVLMNAEWTEETGQEGQTASEWTATVRSDTEGQDYTVTYYMSNHYKVPMGKDSRLNRNTHYWVRGTLTAPGSTEPDTPMELSEVRFMVVPWVTESIEVGGDEGLHYLYVNKKEYTIRNVDGDNTLTFSSSHPVTVTVTKAWYTNKRGKEVNLLNYNADGTPSVNDDGTPSVVETVEVAKLDGTLIRRPVDIELSATPDEGLNGIIHLTSTNPVNNLVRHIKLLVKNTEGDEETVTIHQYPLDYIQFAPGTYSYWSSDDRYYWSNYEYYRADINESGYTNYFTSALWSANTWKPRVGRGSNPFCPRFFDADNEKIYYYWYNYNQNPSDRERLYTESSTVMDHRMYHIQITSTSEDYVLARPLTDADGQPIKGKDNAERVSPSFMINSQLGAVNNTVTSEEAARQYAAQYAEVYTDEKTGETYVYDDWRLPTPAEIKIAKKFQGLPDEPSEAMYEVMSGLGYWTSDGHKEFHEFPGSGSQCLRLVRDVFSPEDLKGKKVSDIFENAGYTKRKP
ncbi:hypothetical protein [Butyricimonas paravirosa]|uniref:fimbrial tip adhesin FimD n=1 Tax=Butyricimonas paravirosa TaxID=1472417 RepID=UPI002430093E|nr:hypothetical protein [Butyricimonas paravirosa]